MDGSLTGYLRLTGTLSPMASLSGTLTIPEYINAEIYEGSTEITPSEEIQVLETTGKMIPDNIVVATIPSNYGKIVWNGAYLRIE